MDRWLWSLKKRLIEEYTIRYSRKEDKQAIESLLEICFGRVPASKTTDNLEGRYLLAFTNKQLIAMTGLYVYTVYPNGVEIDWTCTHPKYREQGIMSELFKRLVSSTDENIYCSCWRINDQDDGKIKLRHVMSKYGFELVMPSVAHYDSRYLCFNCHWRHENCQCYEDLYLRKEIKHVVLK